MDEKLVRVRPKTPVKPTLSYQAQYQAYPLSYLPSEAKPRLKPLSVRLAATNRTLTIHDIVIGWEALKPPYVPKYLVLAPYIAAPLPVYLKVAVKLLKLLLLPRLSSSYPLYGVSSSPLSNLFLLQQ